MKSFLTPTLSAFTPLLPKTAHLGLLSLASKSFPRNPTIFLPLNLKPTTVSPTCSIHSIQSRGVHTEQLTPPSPPGEIHVIVGPMFAGKTTTLLRRIQSESSNGSFQVEPYKSYLQLNKTLKGLCISGRLREALGLLCTTGVRVEPRTYALLLQECIFRKEYKKGRRIHALMVVVGYDPNEYLKTKLLILYVKSGDLGTAHVLFDNLREKSLVSWNAMIAGYVQKGLEEVGLNLYYKMRQTGFIPDQYTFASVFRACATLATLEHGKQAHGVMIKCQIRENVVVNSALMDMYFKCSSLSDGHRVFDKSLNRNVVMWTALISGYGQHGKVVEVLESFHRMKTEGFKPNYVTFLSVLSACSHGGLLDEGWAYFSSMNKDYGIQPRGQHYAAIVDLLGRAGRLQEAYEFVLNSPCKEHSVIWGALLGACRLHGDMNLVKLAAKKFFELEPENPGKYVVLSNAYATSGFWENAAEVRAVMRESGIIKEPGYSRIEVQNGSQFFFKGDKQSKELYELIREMTCILRDAGYVPDLKSGRSTYGSVAIIKSNKDTRYGLDSIVTHDGAKLPCLALPDLSSFRQKFGLDAYDQKSLVSWNAMIAGYVQKGLEEVGLNLYYKMRQTGFIPDQYTFASVFRACATLATLEHGKQAHGVMIKCQIRENVVVNSALMDMYFKCSSLSDGHRVFDKSLNRNVVMWTALISGYGQHGKVVEVLESFHRMKTEGFKPNYVTFLSVLSACSHGGLLDEGWAYFSSMNKDYGIQPRGQHYAAIVDLLGRAGRLQEAYEFVLNSPCKEHSVIWGALLGACRLHGDMNLVKLAAKKFFELEPENPGKYVVLSNAYATSGFWENAAEVRAVMRESGIIKEPGYSRIEVQNGSQFFFKGDKQSKELYELIREMTCILRDAGYVPDLSDT
ncbi:pentatricopeptide repeat-containing protein [Quercus suber]|uniref:thymidine kinase n=1 Tax=Quercus suber TaxID=58331 RepID=A0AAW0K0U8_QUESU